VDCCHPFESLLLTRFDANRRAHVDADVSNERQIVASREAAV